MSRLPGVGGAAPRPRGVGRWEAMAVLGLLVLAVAVGVAWWALSPRSPVVLVDGALRSTSGPDDAAAVNDAVFAALAVAAGVLSGLVVVLRPGRATVVRGAVVLAGGVPAVVLAWRLGVLLGPDPVPVQDAAGVETLTSPVALSSPAPLLLWPASCAAALFLGLLVSLLLRPPDHDPTDHDPPAGG